MRRTAGALAIAIASFVGLGCGEDADPAGENRHVSSFRAEAGIEFRECGEIHTDCPEYDCGAECSDQRESSWACIAGAFETCSPAHVRERVRYSTSGWSTEDVFVVPQADGACHVVRFQVVRAREVGCSHVARQDCSELRYRKFDEQMDWCALWIDGCGESTNIEGRVGDCWL